MTEHKSQSSFPYIAIVAIVAVVAVVVLVMNFSGSDADDTAVVVDEEGNLVGEAARGSRARVASSRSFSDSGPETCICTYLCVDGEFDSCACDNTNCKCSQDYVCPVSGGKVLLK